MDRPRAALCRGLARSTLLTVVVCTIGLLAVSAGSARGEAYTGQRVSVALFGDSVTQSTLIPDFEQDGLAPQLTAAERRFGYVSAGPGLLAASPDWWHFNQSVNAGAGAAAPATGWATLGTDDGNEGTDGPSGFSAITSSSQATATATINDAPEVKVLFNSSSAHCPFTVTAAGRTWTIDPYRPGPEVDTEASIELPGGEQTVTVHGPSCGTLSFDGIVAQRPVPAGRTGVVINNLGHSGEFPSDAFTARVRDAIRQQRYDISVFLWGYIAEVELDRKDRATYVRTMLRRARLARESGGSCLIVQATPILVPSEQVARAVAADRTVAHRAGCGYTNVLAHLWPSPANAERRGLLLGDGIHPTKAGYALISHALAPVLAKLIRAHAA